MPNTEESDQHGGVTLREKPYRDPGLLEKLYVKEEKSTIEIAKELDCAASTVRNWLHRHDIGTRDASDAISMAYGNRPGEVSMHVKSTGAVRWNYSHKGEKRTVFVHRLLAVALWGFEAVKEHDVHHVNEIRWDNRPGNLELMDHSEHSVHHHQKLDYHDRLRIVEMYREGASGYTLAPMFDVTPGAIHNAVHDINPEFVRTKGRGGGAA